MKRIGIDVGGIQLRIASFDENYKLLEVHKIKNDRSLSAKENMIKLLSTISDYSGYLGAGIGCPGPLDLKKGKILIPPNLFGWDNFSIVETVERYTGLKTYLNNDANVAGLAEAVLGGGRGYDSVCYIGISTGIGGAYILNGNIINGANGNAAEFWNMIVNEDHHHHRNANAGSLNEQCSGSGLKTIATEEYGRDVEPKELFSMYEKDDKKAVTIIERAAEVMARGVANITCMMDPDCIVVGGSIAIHNPFFVDMIYRRALKYCIAPEKLRIEKALYGDDAGLIGAALLVKEKNNG